MTRDEIIEMARQAGCVAAAHPFIPWSVSQEALERFAALVVSRHVKETRPKPDDSEREWLQQIAYQHGGIGDLCETEFEFGAMVAAAEREACAKAAESEPAGMMNCDANGSPSDEYVAKWKVAANIRARGEK